MKKLWERWKWQLRIFSRGNELFEGALKRVDEKRLWVENVLEKGFTPTSPIKPPREIPRQQQPVPFVPPEGTSMTGFPEFPQSMEDLLHTEELVAHNVPNPHEFADGFLGFQEFSGWEGFDINHL
jgi:hypothetical protein